VTRADGRGTPRLPGDNVKRCKDPVCQSSARDSETQLEVLPLGVLLRGHGWRDQRALEASLPVSVASTAFAARQRLGSLPSWLFTDTRRTPAGISWESRTRKRSSVKCRRKRCGWERPWLPRESTAG